MRKAIPILLVLLVVPAAAGPSPEKAVSQGSRVFACDLYAALHDQPGNLFLSPWSVTTALAMVREGAKGETASQMDSVLHLPAGQAAAGIHNLTAKLAPGSVEEEGKKLPAYETSIANRVWVQEGLGLVPAFESALKGPFAAPIGRLDFRATAKARAAINAWVAEHTRNRIRDIVPEGLPTADTLLALANAIYFKAAWAEPFEKRWTKDAPFTTASGKEVTCHLMVKSDHFPYLDAGDAAVLEIPYRGGETSFVIVLPKAKDGLPALEAKLDAARLDDWIGRLSGQQVMVGLPRFTFTCSFDLSGALASMGMKDAFDAGAADFTGITTEKPLYIGPVLHKAFVAVDEAGTEAAAATVVMMRLGAAPGQPVEFTADHPFLFLIRHRATGTILFLGRVVDPTRE